MKKLLSVILAIVMLASCAALSLQAFAAEDVEISRIDIDFTCDPKEGAKVGSDYTISLSGTTANGADATEGLQKTACGQETQSRLISHGPAIENYNSLDTYVVITKDDGEVVYPKLSRVYYAPKRTNTVQDSDPNATRGNGSFYEAGSKYNYYLITRAASGYHFGSSGPKCYLDNSYSTKIKFYNESYLVFFLGSRIVERGVDTINITFSCNPVNGAPVGSDYEIDVDVEAEQIEGKTLSVGPCTPLIRPAAWDGQNVDCNDALVAIYESNELLYPGYKTWPIAYAPARKAHAQAHGSDPTGELGVGESNTPAFYENGKTYQYYATIGIGTIGPINVYYIDDDTEVFVNGIKVTDFTKDSYGTRLQIPLATVTCAHVHDMTYHAAVAATVDAEGNVAYYHCEGCGKNFADEAGTQEIANVVVDKLPNTEPHTDPATEPTTEPAQGDDVCAYCGKVHTGPFAGLTRFFHRIILFFRNIFKR